MGGPLSGPVLPCMRLLLSLTWAPEVALSLATRGAGVVWDVGLSKPPPQRPAQGQRNLDLRMVLCAFLVSEPSHCLPFSALLSFAFSYLPRMSTQESPRSWGLHCQSSSRHAWTRPATLPPFSQFLVFPPCQAEVLALTLVRLYVPRRVRGDAEGRAVHGECGDAAMCA